MARRQFLRAKGLQNPPFPIEIARFFAKTQNLFKFFGHPNAVASLHRDPLSLAGRR
jgi:hypothetical protein